MADDDFTSDHDHDHGGGVAVEPDAASSQHADAYIDLVHSIVAGVVDEPDQVEVTAAERGRTTIIEVSVGPDDMGKVIGKGGRNIDAIRALARAAGLRQHERVQVELLESGDEE